MTNKRFITAKDVVEELGVSTSYAYAHTRIKRRASSRWICDNQGTSQQTVF